MLCWITHCQFGTIIPHPTQYSPMDQRAWLPGNYIYRIFASREGGWIPPPTPPPREALVRDNRKAEQSHTSIPPRDKRLPRSTVPEVLKVRFRNLQKSLRLLRSSPFQNDFHNHTKTVFAFYTFILP